MFKVRTSSIFGKHDITWNNGVLSGDEDTVNYAKFHANLKAYGPMGGPYLSGDEAIASAMHCYFVLSDAFTVRLIDGAVPDLPEIPEDAIP